MRHLAKLMATSAFGIGIAVGVLLVPMLHVPWAGARSIPTHATISTTGCSCDGPVGSIGAPLGACDGEVSESDVVAVQTELWAAIFDTEEEPNLSYNLHENTVFTGPGDYEGTNAYDEPFTIHVYAAVNAAFEELGESIVGWYVFADVTGPTSVPVPIVGLIMYEPEDHGYGTGYGFVMAGRMSPEMAGDFVAMEAADAQAIAGGLTPQQLSCAAGCLATKNASLTVALGVFAGLTLAASVALAIKLASCAAAAGIPIFGVLLGGACALIAMAAFATAVAIAALGLAAAFNYIAVSYINCLRGCGIPIYEN